MLEQIGLLDEGLYTYFDDVDICLRARRAGWETWYVPASKITHLEGASTGIKAGANCKVKRLPGTNSSTSPLLSEELREILYGDGRRGVSLGFNLHGGRLQRKPDTDAHTGRWTRPHSVLRPHLH